MEEIKKAVKILRSGGVVVFPTDTAFGIGCRVDNEEAVKRVFDIRKRPYTQATPVLVSSIEMARKYFFDIPQRVERELMEKYWPGALTIILKSKVDKVPHLVLGGGENIGIRMPDSKIAFDIIRGVGVPILGPSANFHGEKTPFRFNDLNPRLLKLVDFVVSGETKGGGLASTVIDCTANPWKILRQGAAEIS